MDLRRGFDKILRGYGHDVYLQRLCRSCSRSGAYHKPQEDCSVCFGSGYEKVLERHTCRRVLARGASSNQAEGISNLGEGLVPEHGWIFYLRHDVEPRQGDRIYDDGFLYRINEVYDPRGPRGRVEYYICGTKRIEGKFYGREQ